MDAWLLKRLQEKLLKLQDQSLRSSRQETAPKIPQEDFLDSIILSCITDEVKVSTERLSRLREIIDFKLPVVLACRSNAFWHAVEKPKELTEEKTFNSVTSRKTSRGSKNSSDVDQSSVYGSPLKLDIIADLSVFEGDSTLPCTRNTVPDFGLDRAVCSKLISLYCSIQGSFRDDSISGKVNGVPTLVSLCNGENMKSVSCISAECLQDQQNNFLGVRISETSSLPAATKAAHMSFHPKFNSLDVLCKARYNILADKEDQLQPEMEGFLLLDLEWRKPVGKSLVLLHDPPSEAKAVVKIQVKSGSDKSPAFSVYQELEILRSVVDGLATTQVNWIGTQEVPLVDSVKDLVEQLKLGHEIVEYRLGETTQETENNMGTDSDMLEDRKDLDFTDHLWKVLQNCTSYSELVEAYSFIVEEVRKGELQPFIHAYNGTTIGQMVRDSYRGQLRAPSMTGLGPLQYLAEMGDQKLTQDYVHIFLSKSLVTMGNLEYYLAGNLEFEDKLERLDKLQNTLEIVLMLKRYLHLPQASLSECCRQILKHYETNKVDESHHFSFLVPRTNLTSVLERFPPSEWRVEGVKLVEGVPERLIYHFSDQQPFDWVKLKEGSEKRGSGDEMSYYLTVLKDSVSILR